MIDLTALQPFVVTFFVIAGVATVLAVAALARVLADGRTGQVRPVVPISAGHPAAAAVTRDAA